MQMMMQMKTQMSEIASLLALHVHVVATCGVYKWQNTDRSAISIIYLAIYICIDVCMYVYIYIYIYI
jgi:hypothetical protein